jgi:phenylacetyl-CoA:acceptor oxidoreductase subunit 1
MTRFVMVIDLRRCIGCQACTASCRHANATPPGVQWRKVLDIEVGAYPDTHRTFVPVGCMHCGEPPCMEVCPTTATRKRADGIVTIDYDTCIGCGYCALACPYQARHLTHEQRYAYGKTPIESEDARADPATIAVATKCSFCVGRVDAARKAGQIPGNKPEVTPACVNSCVTGALSFGDSDDPESNVSGLLRDHKTFRMHEELGTDPGVYYIWDSR